MRHILWLGHMNIAWDKFRYIIAGALYQALEMKLSVGMGQRLQNLMIGLGVMRIFQMMSRHRHYFSTEGE